MNAIESSSKGVEVLIKGMHEASEWECHSFGVRMSFYRMTEDSRRGTPHRHHDPFREART